MLISLNIRVMPVWRILFAYMPNMQRGRCTDHSQLSIVSFVMGGDNSPLTHYLYFKVILKSLQSGDSNSPLQFDYRSDLLSTDLTQHKTLEPCEGQPCILQSHLEPCSSCVHRMFWVVGCSEACSLVYSVDMVLSRHIALCCIFHIWGTLLYFFSQKEGMISCFFE